MLTHHTNPYNPNFISKNVASNALCSKEAHASPSRNHNNSLPNRLNSKRNSSSWTHATLIPWDAPLHNTLRMANLPHLIPKPLRPVAQDRQEKLFRPFNNIRPSPRRSSLPRLDRRTTQSPWRNTLHPALHTASQGKFMVTTQCQKSRDAYRRG